LGHFLLRVRKKHTLLLLIIKRRMRELEAAGRAVGNSVGLSIA